MPRPQPRGSLGLRVLAPCSPPPLPPPCFSAWCSANTYGQACALGGPWAWLVVTAGTPSTRVSLCLRPPGWTTMGPCRAAPGRTAHPAQSAAQTAGGAPGSRPPQRAGLGESSLFALPQFTVRTELVRRQRQTHRRLGWDSGGGGLQRAACDPPPQAHRGPGGGALWPPALGNQTRGPWGPARHRLALSHCQLETSAFLPGGILQGNLGYQPPWRDLSGRPRQPHAGHLHVQASLWGREGSDFRAPECSGSCPSALSLSLPHSCWQGSGGPWGIPVAAAMGTGGPVGPVRPLGGRGVAARKERLSLPSRLVGWAGQALRAPTWFLACLYRVCFRASESKAELRTPLTSNASSAALRRSSPFPKVGTGSKANRPPARCCSTHLHQ